MNNTIKIHKVIPQLFAAVLFFSISFPVAGQEQIREAPTEYLSDTSIIREIVKDSVMIYSRSKDSITDEIISTFILMKNGNYSPYKMSFDSIYVKDFEVYKNRVYFCGYMFVNEIPKGVFGYFYYRLFPTGTVSLYIVDDVSELNKLDAYTTVEMQFMEEPHLVMTGILSNPRLDVLVDITMPVSGQLYGQYYKAENENEKLDDVAVTQNYVVVSSRKVENGIPFIYYLQFKIPHYLGQNIFSASLERIRVSSPVAKTLVLLEHSVGDNYASAYKNRGYPQMEVSFFSAPSTIVKGITIWADSLKTYYPMDIKYHKGSKVYDILARNRYKVFDYLIFNNMQIYHIDQNVYNDLTTYGNITRYPEEESLWSIDPLNKNINYFGASGADVQTLRYYRYNHYQWEECPIQSLYYFRMGKPEGAYVGEWWVPVLPVVLEKLSKEKDVKEIPFPIKCGEK